MTPSNLADESDAKPKDGFRLVYAHMSTEFQQRADQLLQMRNQSLLALGLISSASAILAFAGTLPRFIEAAEIPAVFFFLALIFALPTLMPMRIVYPIRHPTLYQHMDDNDLCAEEIAHQLARQTANAHEANEATAEAVGTYQIWALSCSIVGLFAVASIAFTYIAPVAAAELGALVGAFACALIGMLRSALRLPAQNVLDAIKEGGEDHV